MKKLFNLTINNVWFTILSLLSVGLIIFSFFMPPRGVIDPSVMAAVGEIFAFAALGTVIHGIDHGTTAKVTKGNLTVEIDGKTYQVEHSNKSTTY